MENIIQKHQRLKSRVCMGGGELFVSLLKRPPHVLKTIVISHLKNLFISLALTAKPGWRWHTHRRGAIYQTGTEIGMLNIYKYLIVWVSIRGMLGRWPVLPFLMPKHANTSQLFLGNPELLNATSIIIAYGCLMFINVTVPSAAPLQANPRPFTNMM